VEKKTLGFAPLDPEDGRPWRPLTVAISPVVAFLSRHAWSGSRARLSTRYYESGLWRRLWYWNRRLGRIPRATTVHVDATVGLGLRMKLDLSRLTDCFAYVFGIGEFDVLPIFDKLASEAPVVLDIGANVGTTTIAFARARPRGRVFAFEPSHAMRSSLEANVSINGLRNVEIVPIGLGDEASTFVLVEEMPGNPGSSYLSGASDGAGERVATKRLDDWLGSGTSVDFIKMDVEGFEKKVLLGAERTLRMWHPKIVLELNGPALERQGTSRGEVVAFLAALGYRCFIFEEGELVHYDPSGFDNNQVHNIVALHDPVPKNNAASSPVPLRRPGDVVAPGPGTRHGW
jgi:FkbM family methyltransferase